ncbi:hypothetical protein ACLOJK_012487 [Asimina triloba]
MAPPAQAAGGQSFRLSRRERSFSTQHGFPATLNLPKTSPRTVRPNGFGRSKLPISNRVKAAFREVADSFLTCFTSRHTKAAHGREGDVSKLPHPDAKWFSACPPVSTKESSSTSIDISKKFKHSGSYNSYNAKVEEPQFSIAEIFKATRNFSMANRIGEGGFGFVYKGMLDNGSLVAVKRAKKNVQATSMEFMNEIQTLSKVEHLNLVRFLGYLDQDDERIIIVEYISNGTLREHLDGLRGDVLELSLRLDIAIDVAHAVTYLHMYTDHPIIHRDIKSSNILITDKLRGKVSDFGFARYSKDDPTATHVSTQVKGTAGYLDPEYVRTFQLTDKSDVYSFGVLLVELMTGRHPIEPKKEMKERVTTRWAMQKLKEGEAAEAMDPKLRKSAGAYMAVEKVLELARECLAQSRESRPSMKRCGEVLWGIRKDYRHMEFSFSTSSSTSSRRLDSIAGNST